MRITLQLSSCILFLFAQNISAQNMKNTAPKARKQAHTISIHGDDRVDNYFWMRLSDEQKEAEQADAQTQEVLDYLNAENAYLKAELAHTEKLQEKLFKE